jgi:hypothetical protein
MGFAYHAHIEATEHGMETNTLPFKVEGQKDWTVKVEGQKDSVPAQNHGVSVLK